MTVSCGLGSGRLRGEIQILRSKIATELLKWCSRLSSEVHVLEPILPHTLLQKRLALITGLGAEEFVRTNLPNIARDSHDIQIGTPKFADVTKLLHHILLGMNTMRRVSRTHAPSTIPIRGSGQHLPSQSNHRHMETIALLVILHEVRRPRIRQKLLQNGSVSAMNG